VEGIYNNLFSEDLPVRLFAAVSLSHFLKN